MNFFRFLINVIRQLVDYVFSGITLLRRTPPTPPTITFTVYVDSCRNDVTGRSRHVSEQHLGLSYSVIEGSSPVQSIEIRRFYSSTHIDPRVPPDYSEIVYSVPSDTPRMPLVLSVSATTPIRDPNIENPALHRGDSRFYGLYRILVKTTDGGEYTEFRKVRLGDKMIVRPMNSINGEEPRVKPNDPRPGRASIKFEMDNVKQIRTSYYTGTPRRRTSLAATEMEYYIDPAHPTIRGITLVRLFYILPPDYRPSAPDYVHFEFMGYDSSVCGVVTPFAGDYYVSRTESRR